MNLLPLSSPAVADSALATQSATTQDQSETALSSTDQSSGFLAVLFALMQQSPSAMASEGGTHTPPPSVPVDPELEANAVDLVNQLATLIESGDLGEAEALLSREIAAGRVVIEAIEFEGSPNPATLSTIRAKLTEALPSSAETPFLAAPVKEIQGSGASAVSAAPVGPPLSSSAVPVLPEQVRVPAPSSSVDAAPIQEGALAKTGAPPSPSQNTTPSLPDSSTAVANPRTPVLAAGEANQASGEMVLRSLGMDAAPDVQEQPASTLDSNSDVKPSVSSAVQRGVGSDSSSSDFGSQSDDLPNEALARTVAELGGASPEGAPSFESTLPIEENSQAGETQPSMGRATSARVADSSMSSEVGSARLSGGADRVATLFAMEERYARSSTSRIQVALPELGAGARIQVGITGGQVHAKIILPGTSDANVMMRQISDLRGSLQARGFDPAQLKVENLPGVTEVSTKLVDSVRAAVGDPVATSSTASSSVLREGSNSQQSDSQSFSRDSYSREQGSSRREQERRQDREQKQSSLFDSFLGEQ